MAEFFAAYGLFIAKIVTFFIFFLIMFGIVASGKKGAKGEGQLSISNLNEKYQSNEAKTTSELQECVGRLDLTAKNTRMERD